MSCYVNKVQTICWDCSKACGGCSWSKEFVPIDGWIAEKRNYVIAGKTNDNMVSYRVFECPEYEQDAKNNGSEWVKNRKFLIGDEVKYRKMNNEMIMVKKIDRDGNTIEVYPNVLQAAKKNGLRWSFVKTRMNKSIVNEFEPYGYSFREYGG